MSADTDLDDELDVGAQVVDTDPSNGGQSPARVVELADEPASDFVIDGLGKTVAAVNPEHPSDDQVVGIRFERQDGDPAGPTYHYPASRLRQVGDEWDPNPPKSDAKRERERAIEDHRRKFDAFAVAVRYLGRFPEYSAAWFANNYNANVTPETRGECRYSREDEYRPNIPGAICCWECNDGGRRPEKYRESDQVPAGAPCRTNERRDPSTALARWFREEVVPGNTDERLAEPVEKAIEPNGEYSGLKWDAKTLGSGAGRRRRAAVLRIGYEATVGGALDEQYNHSRACAYLRDIGIDTHAVLPGGDPYITQNDGGSGNTEE